MSYTSLPLPPLPCPQIDILLAAESGFFHLLPLPVEQERDLAQVLGQDGAGVCPKGSQGASSESVRRGPLAVASVSGSMGGQVCVCVGQVWGDGFRL